MLRNRSRHSGLALAIRVLVGLEWGRVQLESTETWVLVVFFGNPFWLVLKAAIFGAPLVLRQTLLRGFLPQLDKLAGPWMVAASLLVLGLLLVNLFGPQLAPILWMDEIHFTLL